MLPLEGSRVGPCQVSKATPPFFPIHAPPHTGPGRPPAGICPSTTRCLGLCLTARKRPIRSEHSLGSVKDDSTASCSGHKSTAQSACCCSPTFVPSCEPSVYHSRLRKCPSPKSRPLASSSSSAAPAGRGVVALGPPRLLVPPVLPLAARNHASPRPSPPSTSPARLLLLLVLLLALLLPPPRPLEVLTSPLLIGRTVALPQSPMRLRAQADSRMKMAPLDGCRTALPLQEQ